MHPRESALSQYFEIHPGNPQTRLLARAAEIVAGGGLVVYPTDTTYALGCQIGNKSALERIRQIRRLDKHHHFTLACRDLSEIAAYARVTDASFRILKQLTPGPYTFLLPATREVPRRLVHPRKKTIGIRIPENPIALGLLDLLSEPMMTTTMQMPDEMTPMADPTMIRDRLEHAVDLIMDGGNSGIELTTVLDLTGAQPEVVRQGAGAFE